MLGVLAELASDQRFNSENSDLHTIVSLKLEDHIKVNVNIMDVYNTNNRHNAV